jgi:hypothetical protein
LWENGTPECGAKVLLDAGERYQRMRENGSVACGYLSAAHRAAKKST